MHPIYVKEVSQKYANKTMAERGETVEGGYVNAEAAIYYARESAELAKVHTLLHEQYHAFREHTARMDEEGQADSYAAMLMRMFNITTVEQILMKENKDK